MTPSVRNLAAWLGPDMQALVLLVACTAILFWTAPSNGEFFWSDAPRHALNGVFVKDLVAAHPFADPAGFAYAYYAQYPALTILFYPPLFYLLSAPFYAVFGVSHATALLAVMVHFLAFGWGCYRLSRLWLPASTSLALAVSLMFLPEIAFWGRQIMLEVPALAFTVWSAVWFVKYLRSHERRHLAWAAALLVLGMYTKISIAFLGLAFIAALAAQRRGALLRDKGLWLVLLGSIVALVPLMVLTLQFGQANVQSVSGVADRVASRASLGGWVWYARQWPSQLGWPMLAAVAAAALAFVATALAGNSRKAGMPTPERVFWLVWLLAGYVFFSAIDLKEARHSVFILPPLVFMAFMALDRLPNGNALKMLAPWALAALTVGWTLSQRPVLYVGNYAQVAQEVARLAPPGSRVLFSGTRDGAFIFNLRAIASRRDLAVTRADKLFLRVAVRRELGVEQKPLDDEAMLQLLNGSAHHYLVVQPGFWDDLEVMRRFETLLRRPQFEEVARWRLPANFPAYDKELVLYRNLAASNEGRALPPIELPIVGRKVPINTP